MITLAILPQATAQEVFDWVVSNLIKQGVKSKLEGSAFCNYRAEVGGKVVKCAAGWCMSNEEYASLQSPPEGRTWQELVRSGLAPKRHAELIGELQWVHDGTNPDRWPSRFTELAKDYGLSVDIMKQVC